MKEEKLFESMADIDEKYIVEARVQPKKKKSAVWLKYGAMAACLCLIIGAAFMLSGRKAENRVQIWDESFAYEDYFKYSDTEADASADNSLTDAVLPYEETRSFSDDRALLESENVIPLINTHPLFSANAHYNSDGSLVSIEFFWHRRDTQGLDNYSDLSVTAGYDEVPQIDDCIEVEIDDKGRIVEPGVTVTQRDGISIAAVGGEDRKKTLTFQNDTGWYQISGSWNDSYEAVAKVLDWFWAHPIDFSRFPIDAGVRFTNSSLSEMPDAFSAYLPDFQEFGFLYETSSIMLKNGEPVSLEAYYVSNATKEQIENSEYTPGEGGCETIHWCIETKPDVYDLEGCVADLEELTQEQVTDLKPADDITTETKVKFTQGGYVITVYASDISRAWELIASLK